MIETHPQIPALIRQMEVGLRSGYNIRQALEIAAKDLTPPRVKSTRLSSN